MSQFFQEKALQEKFQRLQKLSETLKSREKTIKLLEKPTKPQNKSLIKLKDQSTSPLKKPKSLSFHIFPIYNLEPNIISLTRSNLKEELFQIKLEMDPLENELDKLKKLQTELENQIMSSRVIEKQLSIKTGEALEEFQSYSSEDAENFEIEIENEKKYNKTKKKEWKNQKELAEMALNIKTSPIKKKQNHEDVYNYKNSPIKDLKRPFHEDLPLKNEDFESKWKLAEEKDKEISNSSPERSNLDKENNFDKENIDRLSEEIQELLNLQSKKKPIWGNLSEIKEASLEESFF